MSPSKTALIRICDGCGVVTAVDMENTPGHKAEMYVRGQTIQEVTKEDALLIWKKAGRCMCAMLKPKRTGVAAWLEKPDGRPDKFEAKEARPRKMEPTTSPAARVSMQD